LQITYSNLQIILNSPGFAGLGVRARQRGISLIEAVGSMLILAFVTLGTVQLYRVGDKQQRTARNYTNAQTQNREAVRRMVRTIRHAYGVQMSDSLFTGSPSSGPSVIIVSVPQYDSSTQTSFTDHIQFYVSGSTLYSLRSGDGTVSHPAEASPGTVIATGVQSLTFTYYKTSNASSGATTATLNSGYNAATEVNVALASTSGGTIAGATSTENAYVELRNASLGF